MSTGPYCQVDDVIDAQPISRLQIRTICLCCLIGGHQGGNTDVCRIRPTSIRPPASRITIQSRCRRTQRITSPRSPAPT